MPKLLKIDWIVLTSVIMLIGIGLFTLYSLTDSSVKGSIDFQKEFTNQLIFTLIGTIIAIIVFAISPLYFRFKLVIGIVFIITLFLLLYTAFFGLKVNGARRWISFGSRVLENGTIIGGFTIQISEFAKLVVIILTASLLSIKTELTDEAKANFGKIKTFLFENKFLLIAIFLDFLLIISTILQNSLSVSSVTIIIMTSMIFANIKDKTSAFVSIFMFIFTLFISQNLFFSIPLIVKLLGLLFIFISYISSIYLKKLNSNLILIPAVLGLVVGSVGLSFIWNNVLKDYQKQRIEAKISQNRDSQDEGYQQEQSKTSTGAGQMFGQGFRQISDSRLLLLPEPTTDFIFAIFSYKFGFVGATMLISLYLFLICRLFYLADQMNNRFESLVLIGIATMILVQFFANIGMNLDILPVGGTTLPFVSAGGSSLLSMMIGIAFAENIIATNRIEKNIHNRRDKVLINGWNV